MNRGNVNKQRRVVVNTQRRGVFTRGWAGLGAAAVSGVVAVVAGLLVATPAQAAPTGLTVLDPDDNFSHATWGGTTFTELPITYAIAQVVKAQLEKLCDTSVVITRDASQNFVDRATRAAQMQNANVSLTISLNALNGTPWGTAANGGAFPYAAPYANDLAFAKLTGDEWKRFTGRPAAAVAQGATNGTSYPYKEFAGLPGTYAQTFFGFMDHNFDWPVISGTYQAVQYGYEVDGVVSAVARQLQAQGIVCGDTSKGQTAFPTPPSQAELAALFALGFGNWMRYGSDPVNFSTGNFLQSKTLFTVTGPGGTTTPVGLTYNSLDQRSGMFGRGWSTALVDKTQLYQDGSVLVTGGDGSTTAYTRNPDGSYSPVQPGIRNTLSRTDATTLKLTMPDSSTETFTEDTYTGAGSMTGKTDRAGHTWAFKYATTQVTIPAVPNPWPTAPDGTSAGSGTPARTITSLGALSQVTEPGGQTITFTSDSQGRITQATQPGGATWTLAYDSAGGLTSITDPNGHATSYGYDDKGRMTTVTAPDGVTYVTNTYDDAGRVVKQVNGDGATTTISYGTGSTTYTDSTGAQTVFTMDGSGRVTKVVTPLGHTLQTGYTNWDTTTSTDANGHTTKYVYDDHGHVISTTTADGATTTSAYDDAGDQTAATTADGRTTSYTVDGKGHTTAITGPDGAAWAQTFDTAGNLTSLTDPNGNKTSYGYDSHGDLTSVTDAAGGITTLAYDGAGRVTQVTDAAGHKTLFAYDAVGNLTSRTDATGAVTAYAYQADDQIASVTDPNGGKTSYAWTKGLTLASVTDPAGGKTTYGYDSEYRRTTVTDPDGGVTKYTYNAEGLVTGVTDPDGHVTTKTYDAAQNLTSVTDPTGAKTTIAYDTVNRPVTVTDPRGGKTTFAYDTTGRLTGTTDPDGHLTRYAYDAADRVVTVTDPAGHATKYGYDKAGNQTSSTDPTGRVTSTTYDALNRVISTADPAGHTTKYAYDAVSNLTGVTDPNGHTTSYTYDPTGRVTSQADGAGDTTKYAYDKAGNVTGITDPRGGTINLTYTPTGTLASRQDQNGDTTKYQYTAAGVLASMVNPAGVTTAYAHDPAGLLTQVTENSVPGAAAAADTNVTTKYAYDAANRLTTVTDPNGHATSYGYDASGNATATTDASGHVTKFGYDAANIQTSVTTPDGKTTSYGYDPTGHLISKTPPSGAAITYGYDDAGRLTKMTDPTGTSSWSFDQAGRVSSTTDGAGKTLAYAYDPAGHRTALTYPDGTKTTYGYDDAGRVTSIKDATGTTSYSYDAGSDLTGITRPNHTTSTYTYDPTGAIAKIAHTGTTPGITSGGLLAPGATTPTTGSTGTTSTPTPAPTASSTPTASPSSTASPSPTATSSASPAPSASPSTVASPAPTATAPAAPVPVAPTPSPTPTSGSQTAAPASTTTPSGAGAVQQSLLGAVTSGVGSTVDSVVSLLCEGLAICPDAALTAADGLPLTLTYTHDHTGNVTGLDQKSATKHLVTQYTYDPLGRLTSSTRNDGANSTYVYDAAGNRTGGTETDRLSKGILNYQATYSVTNQVLTQTLTPKTTPGLLGPIVGTTTTANTWNPNGQLATSTATTVTSASVLGLLNIAGTATSTTTNSYDTDGHLTKSVRGKAQGTGLGSLLTDVLGLDVSPVLGLDRDLTTTYSYDGLGRMVGETLPDQYAGDHLLGVVGNLLGGGCGAGGTQQGCPAGTRGDTPYAGNSVTVTNDGTTPVSWTGKGGTTDLVWGPEGADHQTSTLPGASIGTASWMYLDGQGTVRATANKDGATTSASAYTDFGQAEPTSGALHNTNGGNPVLLNVLATDAGPLLPNTATLTPIGYTGQQPDPDGGLVAFPHRAYQPYQAQWLQPDQNAGVLDGPQSLNGYGYVNNNPSTFIDPLGDVCAHYDNTDNIPLGCTTTRTGGPVPTVVHMPQIPQAVYAASRGGAKPTSPTSQQNTSSASGYYEKPWNVVYDWLFELGPKNLYYRGGGYIDWINSDTRFQSERHRVLSRGQLGTFYVSIPAAPDGPAHVVQMLNDAFVYSTWPAAATGDGTPTPWDYQAQVGSYQGTVTVSRAPDGRLKVDYNLNNDVSFQSAFWNRDLGAQLDRTHRIVTQHFIWTEYVNG